MVSDDVPNLNIENKKGFLNNEFETFIVNSVNFRGKFLKIKFMHFSLLL